MKERAFNGIPELDAGGNPELIAILHNGLIDCLKAFLPDQHARDIMDAEKK